MSNQWYIPSKTGRAVAWAFFAGAAGGGYVAARGHVEFFTMFGWTAVFMPIISGLLIFALTSFGLLNAYDNKTYNYRHWADNFYTIKNKKNKFLAIAFEATYVYLAVMGGAIAVSSGAEVLSNLLRVPYILGTLIICISAWLVAMFGADFVRRVSANMGKAIVVVILALFGYHAVTNFHVIATLVSKQTLTTNYGDALTGGLMNFFVSATFFLMVVPLMQPVNERKDVLKFSLMGCVIFTVVTLVVTWGTMVEYPAIIDIPVPTLYIAAVRIGGMFITIMAGIMMLLGIYSTVVIIIYALARRWVDWWAKRSDTKSDNRKNGIVSAIVTAVIFSASLFGIVDLVRYGLRLAGLAQLLLVVLPVFVVGIRHEIKKSKEQRESASLIS